MDSLPRRTSHNCNSKRTDIAQGNKTDVWHVEVVARSPMYTSAGMHYLVNPIILVSNIGLDHVDVPTTDRRGLWCYPRQSLGLTGA